MGTEPHIENKYELAKFLRIFADRVENCRCVESGDVWISYPVAVVGMVNIPGRVELKVDIIFREGPEVSIKQENSA